MSLQRIKAIMPTAMRIRGRIRTSVIRLLLIYHATIKVCVLADVSKAILLTIQTLI